MTDFLRQVLLPYSALALGVLCVGVAIYSVALGERLAAKNGGKVISGEQLRAIFGAGILLMLLAWGFSWRT